MAMDCSNLSLLFMGYSMKIHLVYEEIVSGDGDFVVQIWGFEERVVYLNSRLCNVYNYPSILKVIFLTCHPGMALRSGIQTVFKSTGIPPSWLEKRPKLPSRNWLIFLSVTSSVLGLYIYDRRQCKRIRQSYIDKVKHLAEQPVDRFDYPRKVTVYAARWPGDDDYDQGMRHFRKYVKVCPQNIPLPMFHLN